MWPSQASVSSDAASLSCAASTALMSNRTASRWRASSGLRGGGPRPAGRAGASITTNRRKRPTRDQRRMATSTGSSGPAFTDFGFPLERQRLDGRERVVRREVGMQRCHRDVAVAHRLVVRPIVRLPVVLPFLDPVSTARPFGSWRSATEVTWFRFACTVTRDPFGRPFGTLMLRKVRAGSGCRRIASRHRRRRRAPRG